VALGVGRDRGDRARAAGEVLDEEVLAEGRVAVDEARVAAAGRVGRVRLGLEGRDGHVDEGRLARGLVELAQAERVHDERRRREGVRGHRAGDHGQSGSRLEHPQTRQSVSLRRSQDCVFATTPIAGKDPKVVRTMAGPPTFPSLPGAASHRFLT